MKRIDRIQDIEEVRNIRIDTIVADCEGFFETFLYDQLDSFRHSIQHIFLEEDRPDHANYFVVQDLLTQFGFYLIKKQGKHVVWSKEALSPRSDEEIRAILDVTDQIQYYDEHNQQLSPLERERQEQTDVAMYCPSSSTVLELGGRYGMVSNVICQVIGDPSRMVVIEPDSEACARLLAHQIGDFPIFNGVISRIELKDWHSEQYASHFEKPIRPIDIVYPQYDYHYRHQIPETNSLRWPHLQNKWSYQIIGEPIDVNVTLFFETPSAFRLRIRRYDQLLSWKGTLKLFIEDLDDSIDVVETIEIEFTFPDLAPWNDQVVYCKTKLLPLKTKYSSKIPRVMIQTSEHPYIQSPYHWNAYFSLIEMNPEFTHEFYDAKKRRQFIVDHFPNRVVHAYDMLMPGSFKADLFKYCYLYLKGGCYMDSKFICRKPLRQLIQDHSQINCYDPSLEKARYTAIMFHEPHDKRFANCIEQVLQNVETHLSSFTLEVSGPCVQYENFKDLVPVLRCVVKNPDATIKRRYQDNVVTYEGETYITCFYRDYYYFGYKSYDKMFHNGWIYYDNKTQSGNKLLFTYPHPNPFQLVLWDQNLLIRRSDSDAPWDDDVIVHMVDIETHESNQFNVSKPTSGSTKLVQLKTLS